jgi:hypothetical protein
LATFNKWTISLDHRWSKQTNQSSHRTTSSCCSKHVCKTSVCTWCKCTHHQTDLPYHP